MENVNQTIHGSQPPPRQFSTAARQLEESRQRARAFADRMTAGRLSTSLQADPPSLPARLLHQRQRDIERLDAALPRLNAMDRPAIQWTPERWAQYLAHCDASLKWLKESAAVLAALPLSDRTSAALPLRPGSDSGASLSARAPYGDSSRRNHCRPHYSQPQDVCNNSRGADDQVNDGHQRQSRRAEQLSGANNNLAVASDRKPERSPKDIAKYRAIRSGLIGRRMHKAALAVGSVIAWRAAQLLMDCGSNKNLWTASDLHRESDGETFKGTGGLTRCNRKFCATCAADERRRARTRIREALRPLRPERGEHWRFITLTSPTIPAADVLSIIHIFNRAWRILCNGPLWRPLVSAGAKGIEFTVSDIGFHVHIHALVLSRWIPQQTLKDEWTAAIQTAWDEAATGTPINTKDGKLIVDIRLVRAKRTHFETQIGVDDAVNEVCKYLTKSHSWDHIPNDKLVALAEVLRWPRMVEVLGDARTVAGAAGDPSLDTPRLSASGLATDDASTNGEDADIRVIKKHKSRAPPLISLDLSMPGQQWLEKLTARRARQRSFRKTQLAERYRFAEFTLLNGDTWTYVDVLEQRRKSEAWRAARRERHYDVNFNDGQHCPKCAARLHNFYCSACNIVVETRLGGERTDD